MQTVLPVDLARRFEENPLVQPKNIAPSMEGMIVECLLNPGVFRFNKKIWLLVRVAERPEQQEGFISLPVYDKDGEIDILRFDKNDPHLDFSDARVIKYKDKEYLTTLSHLRLMCSEDGISFHEPEGYAPIFGTDSLEAYGIEDCRVTEIDNVFHLTYTMVSSYGVGVGLMQTRDWKHFVRHGMIFPPHNKDCAIFEYKIKDKYFALHRPSSPQLGGNYIWLAASPDLIHWGHHKCIATTRKNKWDSARIGAGCSPIHTPQGWLVIYHGADENHRYCLGAILLDLIDPSKVLARSSEPIMEPTEEYELKGFFGNVIFTNGHVVNGDTIRLYYGASDEVICGAELSIRTILSSLTVK
ncbi:glycoside hydrolase family 130 protein [Chryseolinea sp. H1M3-3]|uniref:glycoside hydrolase family 130 protein n=1 Tax=Chryseolinea sp. H1M3-3 TaxID=3034144 RepID=UPI0023ED62D3|nr:glycoside hydrolase family 130 protein [Chryseolinea sp. H1M3-3]